MNKKLTGPMRAFLVCAMTLVALQGAAHAQKRHQTKTAEIDAVMTTAQKYRLFNGSALVAENGRMIY